MKLYDEQQNAIRFNILRKLMLHNIWGAKHTSYDNLQKSVPKHLRGGTKDVADDSIKEGLLLSHPTSYGLQVSLDPKRADEIKAMLGIK